MWATGLFGSVRVLEGQAVNASKYPMTRIQIRAELLDGGGNVLAAHTAYSGNVLTDNELAGLSDVEMQKKLSLPQGSTISNDRIEPGGEIPFMIVFANEPLGVTRTVCLPTAAEQATALTPSSSDVIARNAPPRRNEKRLSVIARNALSPPSCHCEERSDEAILLTKLLFIRLSRFARNDPVRETPGRIGLISSSNRKAL